MKVVKDTNQRKNDLSVVTVNKVNYIESYKDEFKTLFEDATEEINEEVEYLFILDETSGKDVLINKKHILFRHFARCVPHFSQRVSSSIQWHKWSMG